MLLEIGASATFSGLRAYREYSACVAAIVKDTRFGPIEGMRSVLVRERTISSCMLMNFSLIYFFPLY